MTTENINISEGWNEKEPNLIHLDDPLTDMPKKGIIVANVKAIAIIHKRPEQLLHSLVGIEYVIAMPTKEISNHFVCFIPYVQGDPKNFIEK